MNKRHVWENKAQKGILSRQLPTYLFFIEVIACFHISVLTSYYQRSTNLAASFTEQTIESQSKYTEICVDVWRCSYIFRLVCLNLQYSTMSFQLGKTLETLFKLNAIQQQDLNVSDVVMDDIKRIDVIQKMVVICVFPFQSVLKNTKYCFVTVGLHSRCKSCSDQWWGYTVCHYSDQKRWVHFLNFGFYKKKCKMAVFHIFLIVIISCVSLPRWKHGDTC